MPYGLYMSAEGAHAQATRLEVIAHNLANVETTGFKRELAIIQTRYAEEVEEGTADAGTGEITDIGGGVEVCATEDRPLAGTTQRHRPAGRTWPFEARVSSWSARTTNSSSPVPATSSSTPAGELVTQYGGQQYAVLDDSMSPIVLDREAPWEFTVNGGGQAGRCDDEPCFGQTPILWRPRPLW